MEIGGNKGGPHHHDDHNGDHRIAPISWFLVVVLLWLVHFFSSSTFKSCKMQIHSCRPLTHYSR